MSNIEKLTMELDLWEKEKERLNKEINLITGTKESLEVVNKELSRNIENIHQATESYKSSYMWEKEEKEKIQSKKETDIRELEIKYNDKIKSLEW